MGKGCCVTQEGEKGAQGSAAEVGEGAEVRRRGERPRQRRQTAREGELRGDLCWRSKAASVNAAACPAGGGGPALVGGGLWALLQAGGRQM